MNPEGRIDRPINRELYATRVPVQQHDFKPGLFRSWSQFLKYFTEWILLSAAAITIILVALEVLS